MTTYKTVYVLDRRRNLVECPMIVYESDTDTFTLADGTIVNAEVADASITEAKIVPKTITNASLSDTAGIKSTQLDVGVLKSISTSVTYAGATAAITIPANSIVTDVITVCTETFNGTTPAATIGDDSVANGFLTLGLATGLTSGAVKGEIASDRGTLLWVPGVLSGGDWTNTQGTFTPSSWEVTALHVDSTTHSMDTKTQGSGAGSLSAGSQTKTAASMTTWGSPRRKYYAAANHVNVTIGTTGSPTTGAITVILMYLAVA
jgi:hypothetical protein